MSQRDDMIAVIKKGESVYYNERIITSIDQLPSEAELAKGDVTKEAEARKNLIAQKAQLDAQLASLASAEDKEAKNKEVKDEAPAVKAEAKPEVKHEAKAKQVKKESGE